MPRRGPFFYQHLAGTHDFLIDPIEQLRGEQAQIVLERLQLVLGLVVPVAVPQHLPQRAMLIGQLLNPIIVSIQTQAHDPEDQNAPLLHSRSPLIGIGLAVALGAHRNDFAQDGENASTQLLIGVDVLQSPQYLRNIVTRFRVEINRPDVHSIEQILRVNHLAHDGRRSEIDRKSRRPHHRAAGEALAPQETAPQCAAMSVGGSAWSVNFAVELYH